MAGKVWRINIDGQQHIIEVNTGSFTGSGNVTMDGKVVNKWGASLSGLPAVKFEVQGNEPKLKQKGLWELLLYFLSMGKK